MPAINPQGHRWLCLPVLIVAVYVVLVGGAVMVLR